LGGSIALATLATLAVPSPASASFRLPPQNCVGTSGNLVANCSFTDPNNTTTPTSWTTNGGSGLQVFFGVLGNGSFPASNGTVSQILQTVTGATYSVSFYVAEFYPGQGETFTASAGAGSLTLTDQINEWVNKTFSFVAAGSTTTLTLGGIGAENNWFLDEVLVLLTAMPNVVNGQVGGGVFTIADPPGQAATIVFRNNGVLASSATGGTDHPMTVESTGGTIRSTGGTFTVSGAVVNAGTLTIAGSGGGAVSINGSVVGGNVVVASGGTLRGMGLILGALTVASGGTLSPGNSPGTFTAAAVTMNDGSTLAFDIDGLGTGTGAGNYSRAIVTGANTYTAAGTLAPVLRGITYAANETAGTNSYTPAIGTKFAGVVQAGGGVLGSFSSLTQPAGLASGSRFDAVYNPTSIDLYVTPSAYASGLGQTWNQTAVGAALDRIRPAAGVRTSGNLKTIFDSLAPLSAASIPRALTEIAGEGTANLPRDQVDVARAFGDAVSGRLRQLRGSEVARVAGDGAAELSFGDTGGSVSTTTGLAAGDAVAKGKVSAWTRGVGEFTTNGGDGNNPGFSRVIGGGAAGFDAPLTDNLRAGFSLGYARADGLARNGGGASSSDNYRVGVYAGWTNGAWFANADIGATWSRISTKRTVLGRRVKGSTDGLDFGSAIEVGRTFETDGVRIEPSIGLRHDLVSIKGYTESGDDAFALTVRGETRNALRSSVGARISKTFDAGDGLLIEPEAAAYWKRDLLSDRFTSSRSINGAAFDSRSARPGRDAAALSLGLSATLNDNLKLRAGYEVELRANQTDHVVTAGLRYAF